MWTNQPDQGDGYYWFDGTQDYYLYGTLFRSNIDAILEVLAGYVWIEGNGGTEPHDPTIFHGRWHKIEKPDGKD